MVYKDIKTQLILYVLYYVLMQTEEDGRKKGENKKAESRKKRPQQKLEKEVRGFEVANALFLSS